MKSKSALSQFINTVFAHYKNSMLDFRSYLQQRRILLLPPVSELNKKIQEGYNWKSPFAFAFQGIVLTSWLVTLTGQSVVFFFEPRPVSLFEIEGYKHSLIIDNSRWLLKEQQIKNDIETLINEMIVMAEASPSEKFPMPVPYSMRGTFLFVPEREVALAPKVPRDKAIKTREDEIGRLKYLLKKTQLARHMASIRNWIRPIIFPSLMVLLGAYIFKFMLRIGKTKHVKMAEQGEVVFLYYVTAAFFWVILASNINSVCYSILEFYYLPPFDLTDNIPSPWWIRTLIFYIDTLIKLIIMVWGIIILKKTCKGLCQIFGLEPAQRWYSLWSGGYRMCIILFISFILSATFGIMIFTIPELVYEYIVL